MAREKQAVRQFDKEREMLVQKDSSVVERIYSAGDHIYSLWEMTDGGRFEVTREGNDGKTWGRADTKIAGDLLANTAAMSRTASSPPAPNSATFPILAGVSTARVARYAWVVACAFVTKLRPCADRAAESV